MDAVTDVYGLGLKRPNVTRWNSVFLAVERMVRLMEDQGDDEFRKLCSKLDDPKFSAAEKAFLEEYRYVGVMNILQICSQNSDLGVQFSVNFLEI